MYRKLIASQHKKIVVGLTVEDHIYKSVTRTQQR